MKKNKNQKLSIENLKVESFVTSMTEEKEATVKGGYWSLHWSCFWCTRH